MAKCQVVLPEDLIKKISRLGNQTDVVVARALEKGAQTAFPIIKSALHESIGNGLKAEFRSTGELEASLGVSPVKLDKGGNANIKIGFSEPRRDGESNAKLANIIEYGSAKRPARPFMKPGARRARAACKKVIPQAFEEELKKI